MGWAGVVCTPQAVLRTLCSVHLPVNLVLLLRYYSHHGYEIVLGKQSQNVHFIQQCMTRVGKASCLMFKHELMFVDYTKQNFKKQASFCSGSCDEINATKLQKILHIKILDICLKL